jgi:hypothetical protein
MIPVDAAFETLNHHGIPVNADTRRWFSEGRGERERSRDPNAVRQGEAFRNLLRFRSWGNAARLAGWLFEHKRLTQPVQVAAPIVTRTPREAMHFAHIIASRHGVEI